MPNAMNFAAAVSAWARTSPDAPAISRQDGSLTYAELDRVTASMAHQFQTAGVERGDIVAVRSASQLQHLITILALARLGAGHLSFHAIDPKQRQQQIVNRLNLSIIVTDKTGELESGLSCLAPPPDNPKDCLRLPPMEVPFVVDKDLPCVVAASSGTTGEPKVSVLTQALTAWRLRQSGVGMPNGPGSRFLSLPYLSFHGAKYQVLSCLSEGGCVVLVEDTQRPQDFIEFVRRQKVSYIAGTPSHADRILAAATGEGLLLPQLEAFRLSSTLVAEPLRKAVREHLTPNLHVSYGIGETGFVTSAPPSMLDNKPGIVGKPLPGVQAQVVDENGAPLAPGQAGFLRVKSPSMVNGYLDAPEQTAHAFRDGWFHTGDLLEAMPDGALVHHGRADDVMILDGLNIYPAEIENVLSAHPAVVEAAAFSIKHAVKGDIPVAAVVVHADIPTDDLYTHCRSWLGVKAPSRIFGVDRLPKNAVGKVLIRELERRFRKLMDHKDSFTKSD